MNKELPQSVELHYLFSRLPSVDKILNNGSLQDVVKRLGHVAVRDCARQVVDQLRREAAAEQASSRSLLLQDSVLDSICLRVRRSLDADGVGPMRQVLNLSGTVVHTNLGRSILPEAAVQAMAMAARSTVDLEYELSTGKRGERETYLEKLVCELTGAEAATVVNNNAAAVVLVLQALANSREVVLSRGELVEIGASFRIPDVMESAGCHLVEVGSSNRTHLIDFANAIGEQTAMLMQVHTSNYSVQGFTSSVSTQELANLAHAHDLPLVSDLGSGTLVDLSAYSIAKEPTVKEVLAAGADVVTFSGDKLLGGPQAGLIVGKKRYVDAIRRHPLKRALRIDKLRIAALESVLTLYRSPQTLSNSLPVLRLFTRSVKELDALATRLLPHFEAKLGQVVQISVLPCESQIGSGALPSNTLASVGIALRSLQKESGDKTLQALAAAFRGLEVPVIGRLSDGSLLFDLRCLEDESILIAQLEQLMVPVVAS
jgi:L-seryl-tRNA(Ser) seleniumtransferase